MHEFGVEFNAEHEYQIEKNFTTHSFQMNPA